MKLTSKKSLYVHIPFCEKKCFYCSFAVAVGQRKRIDRYLDCLLTEAERYDAQPIETVYIGGGTPTFMDHVQLDRFLRSLRKKFLIAEGAEFTVEANPEGLTKSKLMCLKDYGVNRISLGVQTFNDRYLKFLGRVHTSAQIQEAFDCVRVSGFDNVSVDLMFGFPQQKKKELMCDIDQMCALGSEHVSIYALTVDPNSRFFAQSLQLKDQAAQAREYMLIMETLARNGFYQYEVSNFSKPGFCSVHNQHYWQCYEYIGLGMGAHSFVNGRRYANSERLLEYISMIQKGHSAVKETHTISSQEQLTEALLFGLRMNTGVDIAQLQRRFDVRLRSDQVRTICTMVAEKFLMCKKGVLCATDKGRLVLDGLCAELY